MQFLLLLQVVCKKFTCGPNEKCKVEDGMQKCHPVAPCKAVKSKRSAVLRRVKLCASQSTQAHAGFGDPHYHTFDGFNFNFQGTCKYVISKTCGNLDGLVPFSVTERNDNRGNTAVSFVREVDVSVYGYNITLLKNQVGRVMVDGELLNLPVQLGEGRVSVSQCGHTAVMETDFGLSVSYDWNSELVIKLPSSYYTSVCGLCGNFNGDELQNPAGKAVSSVKDWGKSWQTPDKDEKHPCWDTCEEKLSYMKKFGCPMSCQRHSHYEICTSPCQPSCPFPDQKSPCPGACVEACVCDKGYVLSAGVCVPAKSCGAKATLYGKSDSCGFMSAPNGPF
ncbi:IgGFc-binding protein [Dissostichus eleginoides]|uniref:IgGFc-binding protein n=1 Tax=Dissostichus eleginoides TaxID=100907 RepID=A0AAD9C1N6_DISEL|nr:IgGFc-binding protein [Dissostichus eleginoides]